ncbi:protein-tyrosine sulfotransferase 2 [Clupea harengus]|uniref:Protein-tyrosine sulfotransferase n=1 Tax=Clupea harengus TaxID=7950 RepID=A0A6P3VFF6_CLUHA|nr:protein-tyrosine sulfotransferase 2 [Clupea harengus]
MRLSLRRGATSLLWLLFLGLLLKVLQWLQDCSSGAHGSSNAYVLVRDRQNKVHGYNHSSPLVFVGGVPRSGTTLMRVMLDAHPDIRCGEETRVIPRLLGLRQGWAVDRGERQRLEEAGITQEILDTAVAAFLLEVIARHGEPAPLLCNKDPFTLKSAVYLSQLFPNSKFILMLRDGRATVHSMISRRVTISGFNLSSYRDCLTKWNRAVQSMFSQCSQVGSHRCLEVHYEDLVLHPRATLQRVLNFLEIEWHEGVLHHEEAIGQPGGVSLSRIERSTDQVIKPVNLEALTRWVGHIPEDVLADMKSIAPMLRRLGYDPSANPPKYGKPDAVVINNTDRVLKGDFKIPSSLKGQPQQVHFNGTVPGR